MTTPLTPVVDSVAGTITFDVTFHVAAPWATDGCLAAELSGALRMFLAALVDAREPLAAVTGLTVDVDNDRTISFLTDGTNPTPTRVLSLAEEAVHEQRKWIAEHGRNEAGYVARYGSVSDHEGLRFGDGGEAIYAADKAQLDKLIALRDTKTVWV